MKLTSKYQHSVKCSDGKRRNFMVYFLNDIQILKLKCPFDNKYDHGAQITTEFKNEFIENGRLYMTKIKFMGYDKENGYQPIYKIRKVSYPISKQKLNLINKKNI